MKPTHFTRTSARTAAAFTTAILVLTACAGNDQKSSTASPDAVFDRPQSAAEPGLASNEGVSANSIGNPVQGATADAPADIARPLGLDGVTRQLVINATVGVEVADVGKAVSQVVSIAVTHGGQVYDSQVDLGDPEYAHGTLVLRMPPDQVDDAIADLADLGTVVSRAQNTDDVTDVVVDLEARILTARVSVESIRALMSQTKDLNQLVFLESELTNRQTTLEQLLGQQRTLAAQVALATLTVELSVAPIEEPVVPTTPTKQTGVSDAFSTGWHGFITVMVGIAIAIGYAAPFLAVGMLVGGLLAVVSRRRRWAQPPTRNRSAAPLLPPAPDADQQTTAPDSVGAARNP